jgi:hypothetical protein
MATQQQTASRALDGIALAVLGAVALIAWLTFRDYGLSWDDYTHAEYGDLLLSLYTSGFADRRALSFVNLYYYGGGFDLLAAALAKILPLGIFETRRLLGAAVGILGLFVVWRLGRRIGGPLAGLLALVLLACCPEYYGHMFMNPKDSPFAVAMVILLLGLVRAFEQYPRPGIGSTGLVGLGAGLSLGARIMGAFNLLSAFVALLFVFAVEATRDGVREAAKRAGRFVTALIPAVLLGYLVMALVWPWAVTSPLNPFHALGYFSRFFEEPWQELFGGQLISVLEMPRSYVPTLFALKLPEVFWVLALIGTAGAAVAACRRDVPLPRRTAYLLVALAAILPIAVEIALRPAMYNGIRHLVFVLPPLAVLGGLAAAHLIGLLRRPALQAAAVAVFALGVSLPVVEMTRLHPFEYTYFNALAGGVASVQSRYMLDYWGLSLKPASQALLARLQHKKPPAGRRWKVAVCGPHRSPQVELGPDFETTWDPRGADFAIMLGVFYCARLNAPLIAEIEREGVPYARVYDIRERRIETILAPAKLEPLS